MARVGSFAVSDLARVEQMDDWLAALSTARQDDLAYSHSLPAKLALTPEGLRAGVNVFGPGNCASVTQSPISVSSVRGATSVILNQPYYIGNSLSILDRDLRLFTPAIENLGRLNRLAEYDPEYFLDDTGALCIRESVRAAPMIDVIALPVCAAGFPNYGHFLYDGLPAVYLLSQILPPVNFRIVGQPLRDWQRQILAALGLDGLYMGIAGPVRFRKMVASTLLAMHVSYPSSFARPLFDFLRFRFGAPGPVANRKLFISRGDSQKRWLVNCAEVEACAAELGFEIIQPETLSFIEQIRTFANARVVVGESGAGLANLGFCAPGTSVLEIQPEIFNENWTRGMCFIFGHRWHIYQAKQVPEFRSLLEEAQASANIDMAFHVDIPSLRQAVATAVEHASPSVTLPLQRSVIPGVTSETAAATASAPASLADPGREGKMDEVPVDPPVGPWLAELVGTGRAPEVLAVAPPAEVVRPDFVWASDIDGNVAQFKAQIVGPEARRFTAPGLGVYAVGNVTVVGWDQFVLHGGEVVRDTLAAIAYWLPGRLTESFVAHESIHLRRPAPIRRLDDSLVYFVGCEPAWGNYGQWMTQVLPKLVVFVHLSLNRPEMRIIMPEFASDSFVGQTIRLLGISEDKIVRVASNEAVAARRALMMTRADSWNLPPFCRVAADFLAARIEAAPEPARTLPRRVYLKRADQAVRKVVNIADLKPALDRFGFEILELGGLSLVDQIGVMRTATHVIAEHGAGLANIIFCKATPVVLELFNPACPQPRYWTLAALAKCSYGFLVGRHAATPAAPAADWNTDYVIERSEFEAAVAAVVPASA